MLALSLTQPFATLVAIGAKRIETRGWKTSYRGELAIHASKGYPKWARELARDATFARALTAGGYDFPHELPLGVVVATCELTVCVPTDQMFLPKEEAPFGDFSSGRYAWFLADVRPLKEPVPARGALGLWKWEPPANLEELYA